MVCGPLGPHECFLLRVAIDWANLNLQWPQPGSYWKPMNHAIVVLYFEHFELGESICPTC
jgi:hypothetical protein